MTSRSDCSAGRSARGGDRHWRSQRSRTRQSIAPIFAELREVSATSLAASAKSSV